MYYVEEEQNKTWISFVQVKPGLDNREQQSRKNNTLMYRGIADDH